MNNHTFLRCNHCGNFVDHITNSSVPIICCGEKMNQIVANSVDASAEKHVPKVTIKNGKICVEIGTIIHPSEKDHHIEFIYLQTKLGGQRKTITVGESPKAKFATINDTPLTVYAYCNLHGLWKSDVMCDCGCGQTIANCSCDCDCVNECNCDTNCDCDTTFNCDITCNCDTDCNCDPICNCDTDCNCNPTCDCDTTCNCEGDCDCEVNPV